MCAAGEGNDHHVRVSPTGDVCSVWDRRNLIFLTYWLAKEKPASVVIRPSKQDLFIMRHLKTTSAVSALIGPKKVLIYPNRIFQMLD